MKLLLVGVVCCVLINEISAAFPHYLNDLGCWKDTGNRAVPTLEDTTPILDGGYIARSNAIQKCAKAAWEAGYDVMCVQNGGWCASSATARKTFTKYGPSSSCAADGEGGPWGNHCYEINTIWEPKFTPVGCYKDTGVRAIPTLEGSSSQLDGTYKTRADAVRKCARLAASRSVPGAMLKYFANQDGGWCAAGTKSADYDQYGISNKCADDGKGGPWANAVYSITSYKKFTIENIGCFLDKKIRAIRPVENNNLELTGDYTTRQDAIAKCARYAKQMGFKVFALQNGGWCATAEDAHLTYNKYGPSTSCAPHGKGGPWGNQVYKITDMCEIMSY